VLIGGLPPAAAQDAPTRPGLRLIPARATGPKNYTPNTWGLLSVDVENRSDESAEVTAALGFAADPTLQFARRYWAPARSRRTGWLTVRAPSEPLAGTQNLRFRMLLYEGDGSSGVVVRSPEGEMVHNSALRTTPLKSVTALIEEFGPTPLAGRIDDAREATVAMRVGVSQPRFVYSLTDEFLPHSLAALDGLDQMVIASDRIGRDAAALLALRRWLYSGGRIWIMLDLVSPETVALLLEDAWSCEIVDRVSLTALEINGVGSEAQHLSTTSQDFEEPIELVRVLPSGVEVDYEVNGWPAAFRQRVGDGHVLFTTLAARGWTRPRPGTDRVSDPLLFSGRVSTPPFEHLGFEFIQPRERPAPPAAIWQPVLEDQIGYETLGRGTVFGVLGGFCAALFVAGAVLSWQSRLEWLRWIAPGVALVATGALAAFGYQNKQSVPDTVALGQFVQVAPGTSDVIVTGEAAIYHQQPSEESVSTTSGGVLWPDMEALGGTTRRMVWTDMNRWHWENLELPAGVRRAPFQTALEVDRPLMARARFGPDGLEGQLATGPFAEASDALIATPAGARLALHLSEDGQFTAAPDDVLAPGAFISSGLLSQEQRRRQEIYARLFTPEGPHARPDRPMLFVWADALDSGFQFPETERRAGSSLLSIPLTIDRAPPGTRVRIPAPFIQYRAGPGPGETAFTSAYSNHSGRWEQQAGHTRNWLSFQMPETLLPLDLERVRLSLQITGPAGRIQIMGVADGQPVPLETVENPVGTMHFEIDRTDVLAPDREGRLLIGVFVGIPRDTAGARPGDPVAIRDPWRIEFLRLEAEGQMQP
jgi:hypothetical protein